MRGIKVLSLDLAVIMLGFIVFFVSLVVSSIMFDQTSRYILLGINIISVIIIISAVNTLCNDLFV